MREKRVAVTDEEEGGAVCFINASVTPQSTADKTRQSSGNSSSMGTSRFSVCNMDYGQKWTVLAERGNAHICLLNEERQGNEIDYNLDNPPIYASTEDEYKRMLWHTRTYDLGLFSMSLLLPFPFLPSLHWIYVKF